MTCARRGVGFEQLRAGMCTSIHERASAAKNHGQAHVQAWRKQARLRAGREPLTFAKTRPGLDEFYEAPFPRPGEKRKE